MDVVTVRIPEVDQIRLKTIATRKRPVSYHLRRAIREYLDQRWVEMIRETARDPKLDVQLE